MRPRTAEAWFQAALALREACKMFSVRAHSSAANPLFRTVQVVLSLKTFHQEPLRPPACTTTFQALRQQPFALPRICIAFASSKSKSQMRAKAKVKKAKAIKLQRQLRAIHPQSQQPEHRTLPGEIVGVESSLSIFIQQSFNRYKRLLSECPPATAASPETIKLIHEFHSGIDNSFQKNVASATFKDIASWFNRLASLCFQHNYRSHDPWVQSVVNTLGERALSRLNTMVTSDVALVGRACGLLATHPLNHSFLPQLHRELLRRGLVDSFIPRDAALYLSGLAYVRYYPEQPFQDAFAARLRNLLADMSGSQLTTLVWALGEMRISPLKGRLLEVVDDYMLRVTGQAKLQQLDLNALATILASWVKTPHRMSLPLAASLAELILARKHEFKARNIRSISYAYATYDWNPLQGQLFNEMLDWMETFGVADFSSTELAQTVWAYAAFRHPVPVHLMPKFEAAFLDKLPTYSASNLSQMMRALARIGYVPHDTHFSTLVDQHIQRRINAFTQDGVSGVFLACGELNVQLSGATLAALLDHFVSLLGDKYMNWGDAITVVHALAQLHSVEPEMPLDVQLDQLGLYLQEQLCRWKRPASLRRLAKLYHAHLYFTRVLQLRFLDNDSFMTPQLMDKVEHRIAKAKPYSVAPSYTAAVEQLSCVLRGLGHEVSVRVPIKEKVLYADVVLPKANVAFQVETLRSRSYDDPAEPLGSTLLVRSVLRSYGYKVVPILLAEWNHLNEEERLLYSRSVLQMVTAGVPPSGDERRAQEVVAAARKRAREACMVKTVRGVVPRKGAESEESEDEDGETDSVEVAGTP